MTYEIFTAFFIGALIGLLCRKKDKDWEEQKQIYEDRYVALQKEFVYYKELCKWHAENRSKK